VTFSVSFILNVFVKSLKCVSGAGYPPYFYFLGILLSCLFFLFFSVIVYAGLRPDSNGFAAMTTFFIHIECCWSPEFVLVVLGILPTSIFQAFPSLFKPRPLKKKEL